MAKNKAKRKAAREEALEKASVETLEGELAKIEELKRAGLATNEKVQRVKVLEDALARREAQRDADAARGAPAPAPVPKVKNIGALRAPSSGMELATTAAARADSGLGERRVQDSVYYHPTLNPTGKAPPGKPQKYKAASQIRAEAEDAERAGEDEDGEDDGWGVVGEPRAGSGAEASASPGTLDVWIDGVGPPPLGPPPPLPPPPGAQRHRPPPGRRRAGRRAAAGAAGPPPRASRSPPPPGLRRVRPPCRPLGAPTGIAGDDESFPCRLRHPAVPVIAARRPAGHFGGPARARRRARPPRARVQPAPAP